MLPTRHTHKWDGLLVYTLSSAGWVFFRFEVQLVYTPAASLAFFRVFQAGRGCSRWLAPRPMTNVLGGQGHATYEHGLFLNGEPASRAEVNRARMKHSAEKELVALASKDSGFGAGHWNWQPVGGRTVRTIPQPLARCPASLPHLHV